MCGILFSFISGAVCWNFRNEIIGTSKKFFDELTEKAEEKLKEMDNNEDKN